CMALYSSFFFHESARTELDPLSLHDALPIWSLAVRRGGGVRRHPGFDGSRGSGSGGGMTTSYKPPSPASQEQEPLVRVAAPQGGDRKSTRLNSSHVKISYAVFCLKKK